VQADRQSAMIVDVRFRFATSALPPKADMCSATSDVGHIASGQITLAPSHQISNQIMQATKLNAAKVAKIPR
jgi:hypothetical protein